MEFLHRVCCKLDHHTDTTMQHSSSEYRSFGSSLQHTFACWSSVSSRRASVKFRLVFWNLSGIFRLYVLSLCRVSVQNAVFLKSLYFSSLALII